MIRSMYSVNFFHIIFPVDHNSAMFAAEAAKLNSRNSHITGFGKEYLPEKTQA